MNGKIKRIIDQDGGVLPVTVPDAIFIREDYTFADKLFDERMGTNSYVIDIERYGITQGLPSKPYEHHDYEQANQNILGISRAIDYAFQHDYNEVVLPRGQYSLCFPNRIQMKSYITLNLNGSLLKVMYDSESRSPFDDRDDSTDIWRFEGIPIELFNCKHAHIKNGMIEGDRYERSFQEEGERAVEGSYGILFAGSSQYCSISHCEISGFMGDNVSFVSASVKRTAYNHGSILASLDQETGVEIEATDTLITPMLSIPDDVTFFLLGGQGYNRVTVLNNKYPDAFFYDDQDQFIGAVPNRRVHTHVTIPLSATKMRLLFKDETNPDKDMQLFIEYGGYPHHNVVEHCELYNGHRGGITLAGNYNVIRHNIIRGNGKNSLAFLDGKPPFNDPTRYAINQEDGYGDKSLIENNVIYDGFHGILVGSHSVIIKDNRMYNLDSHAIILYGMSYAQIIGNYIDRVAVCLLMSGTSYTPAVVTVKDNYFYGDLLAQQEGYQMVIKDNFFFSSNVRTHSRTVFEGNIINYIENGEGEKDIRLQGIVKNCQFINIRTTSQTVRITSNYFDSCRFTNIEVSTNGLPSFDFNYCEFDHCVIRDVWNQSQHNSFSNCTFIDSLLQPESINQEALHTSMTITNSTIELTSNSSLTHLLENSSNVQNAITVTFDNVIFTIHEESDIDKLVHSHYATRSLQAIYKNSTFTYLGSQPLQLEFNNQEHGTVFDFYNNSLNNVILSENDLSTMRWYNPNTHAIAEPHSGFYLQSERIYDANPQSGSYIGWVCIKSGYATETAWSAETEFQNGDRIHANENVYQCVVTGISSNTPPNHSVGTNTDGTVEWLYLGSKASFAPYGIIE
ncbi:right-handed parallel beta-helix repeat-containing protein [Alkalihalobacillus sp. LMS39]|uniref:right-handed parallel beta-helix repeat-containing protein n=1 Tax=Alkalihalobacillus sp. LMS39 TaxID=2924032 RepID=UPI001FB50F30|nr:right-handed parallel beta-helix repeat-containing protein [Alkalihalobacillus sp. LMS39]UOE92240.1 hypothetical protein MM271_13325 [Alkalihalobacillus sp. LMS39]